MANYQQRDLTGAQEYLRSNRIVIENPLQDIQSVSYFEEQVILVDNVPVVKVPNGQVTKILDNLYEIFPLVNPLTDLPLGQNMTYLEAYTILYSAYRFLASCRDYPIPEVYIYAGDADKAEGNADTTAFTFTVVRRGKILDPSSVDWAVTGTGDNPANADDFGGTFPSGTLEFSAWDFYKTLTIQVSGDTTPESNETFTVTLSNPQGCMIDSQAQSAIGTIQNDDTGG